MKARIITRNAIKCKKCGDVIESNFRHDYKRCSCGKCAVDGEHDYLRRCEEPDNWEDLSEVEEIEVNPKYKVGDIVLFTYPIDLFELKGKIVSVDTYRNSVEINYDIMSLDSKQLCHTVNEESIINLLK